MLNLGLLKKVFLAPLARKPITKRRPQKSRIRSRSSARTSLFFRAEGSLKEIQPRETLQQLQKLQQLQQALQLKQNKLQKEGQQERREEVEVSCSNLPVCTHIHVLEGMVHREEKPPKQF